MTHIDAFFSDALEHRDRESQLVLRRIDSLQDGAKTADKAEWLDKRYETFRIAQANFDRDIAAASPEEAERLRLDQKANIYHYGAFIAGEYAASLGNHPDRIPIEKEAILYDGFAAELEAQAGGGRAQEPER